jgi:hypothetical protein
MKKILLIAFLLAAALPAMAKESNGGVIYSEKGGFSLSAPRGWVLDNTAGKSEGLDCVMYPKGGSWATALVVIYAQIFYEPGSQLEDFITKDCELLQEKSETLKIKRVSKGKANNIYPVVIVDFTDDKMQTYERCAYVFANGHVLIVAVASKDKKKFVKNRNRVNDVLKSVSFMSVDKG